VTDGAGQDHRGVHGAPCRLVGVTGGAVVVLVEDAGVLDGGGLQAGRREAQKRECNYSRQ